MSEITFSDWEKELEVFKDDQDPVIRAFFTLWVNISETERTKLLKFLKPSDRLKIIKINPLLGHWNKDPSPDELAVFLDSNPEVAIANINPINHPKSRMILINYYPGFIRYIDPKPTDREIFTAVMLDPNSIEYIDVSQIDKFTYQKYFGLALYLSALRHDNVAYSKLKRLKKYSINKSNEWVPYWRHILGDKK